MLFSYIALNFVTITFFNYAEPASPGNLTVVTSTQTTDPSDPYLNVVLQWDHQQLLNQNYTITISPSTADSVAIYNTFNTFIQLALLYDQDYNISVVAKSCIGNSMPEKIRIRIVDNCRLIRNGILTDNCLPEITITTLIMTDEMMANISINDSTSDLGSQQHG